MGWTTGARFPAGVENFSPRHRVQTGSGARLASYPLSTLCSLPGCKASDLWRWPLSSLCCRG